MYITNFKDILNIDLLEECDDRYITGNHLPAFAYESIEQIEPNILSKYIHVMRIIKKKGETS